VRPGACGSAVSPPPLRVSADFCSKIYPVPKNANVLTAAEAAELADVNPAQLKSWLDTGKFESFLSIKEETTGQLKHFSATKTLTVC
jgi:hypothetical protein